MKKKLKFLLSSLLIVMILFGSLSVPVASYEIEDQQTESKITSSAILLVNLDTDTVCYKIEPDRKRYASYMSELMTFIVAVDLMSQQKISPEKSKVEVKQSFIDSLPHSDGSLDLFIGKTLTLRDLLNIMMLNSGSDAAYLIAHTLTNGDIDNFVTLMNNKLLQIGCTNSQFITPGYSESNQHFTSCRDIYQMYKVLADIKLYQEIMESPTYIPPGYEIEEDQPDNPDKRNPTPSVEVEQDYEITTENSFWNPASPYYFRYSTGGKYSFDPTAKANLMTTMRYRGKSYLFVAMHGKNGSEQNAFADAKTLAVWAYLNLSDRKVIDADDMITSYRVSASWGEYDVGLYASNSASKTLPMEYSMDKFSYEILIPEYTHLPVFPGQSIGTAQISYDGEKLDDVNLISVRGEGLSLLGDVSRFGVYAFGEILSNQPPAEALEDQPIVIILAPEATEAPTAAPTEAPTEAPAAPTQPEETEADDEDTEDWE